jgi:hypothetical protein
MKEKEKEKKREVRQGECKILLTNKQFDHDSIVPEGREKDAKDTMKASNVPIATSAPDQPP